MLGGVTKIRGSTWAVLGSRWGRHPHRGVRGGFELRLHALGEAGPGAAGHLHGAGRDAVLHTGAAVGRFPVAVGGLARHAWGLEGKRRIGRQLERKPEPVQPGLQNAVRWHCTSGETSAST